MISLTIFKNLYDNKTDKNMQFETPDDFMKFLHQLSSVEYKEKKDAPLMSPATFLPNTTRANKSVVNWAGWAAVDVDDHVFEGNLEKELHDLYGQYTYVCYSTASSTKEHPKFRLVFPLSENVPANKIKHFWFALNKTLGDIGDPQTKDLSRMYFVPGNYAGAHSFIFTNAGELMSPVVLMDSIEYAEKPSGNAFLDSLPEKVRNQILEYRKNQMTNTSIAWDSYHNCPFVNKALVAEYNTISETGWYRKMYQIMVSIAMRAIKQRYPISSNEIAEMCAQIDRENGGWYNNRPLEREATGAINFAYENVDFK